MIQLFHFLLGSVDIILLLSTLQWVGFFPFMVLPDLFMFALDKWEGSQVQSCFVFLCGLSGF